MLASPFMAEVIAVKSKQGPFNLPEAILKKVVGLLSTHDLLTCMLVSSQWHASIVSLSDLLIHPFIDEKNHGGQLRRFILFCRHGLGSKIHLKSLTLRGARKEFIECCRSNITVDDLHLSFSSDMALFADDRTNVVRYPPGVEEFLGSAKFFCLLIKSLVFPDRLKKVLSLLNADSMELQVYEMKFSSNRDKSFLCLPLMKRLNVGMYPGVWSGNVVELVEGFLSHIDCPNLEVLVLSWCPIRSAALEQYLTPKLKSLTLIAPFNITMEDVFTAIQRAQIKLEAFSYSLCLENESLWKMATLNAEFDLSALSDLRYLHLSHYQIQTETLKRIIDATSGNLRHLSLSLLKNRFDDDFLFEALAQGCPKLESFFICNSPFFDDTSCLRLAKALRHCPFLAELHLCRTGASATGFRVMFEQSFLRLDIFGCRGCQMDKETASYLINQKYCLEVNWDGHPTSREGRSCTDEPGYIV